MAVQRRNDAIELMTRFAERTGLTSSDNPPRRYLWTDAFAVCNFLGLADATGDSHHTELALRLVDQVHHVLGRHRGDDSRTGWISGLPADEGEAHPTIGGLRIGKRLPERLPHEHEDEQLEWDRDGQYFHYLTKWMHALDQTARCTGQALFNLWARELARSAHRAFAYRSPRGGPKCMYWKLSIDLSRPLVASMGQHDPLDGLITYAQLEATGTTGGPKLSDAIADFCAMVDPRRLATSDPLGIGGLLVDAYRAAQLERQGTPPFALVDALHEAALAGLSRYVDGPDLRRPALYRLAFRELGLAIGLATLDSDRWPAAPAGGAWTRDRLAQFASLRNEIAEFWLREEHRRLDTWLEHADINDVMLATSLEPDGFLRLRPPG